jgi:cytochrome c oxidase subunit IV
MTKKEEDIENSEYSRSAIIFTLFGLIIWLIIFIFAIFLTAKYWRTIRNVWKSMSLICLVFLSPLLSIIFVLFGLTENN